MAALVSGPEQSAFTTVRIDAGVIPKAAPVSHFSGSRINVPPDAFLLIIFTRWF